MKGKHLIAATIFFFFAARSYSQVNLKLSTTYSVDGAANGLDVSYRLPGDYGDSKDKIVLLFDKLLPLQRTRDTVSGLQAKDNAGQILFHSVRTQTINGNDFNAWQADRVQSGALQISYHVTSANPIPAQSGPVRDLQAAGNGISGSFGSFLLLPYTKKKIDLFLNWELPEQDDAVCTHGNGKTVRFQASFNDLLETQFLAGKLYAFNSADPQKGFKMYGLGKEENGKLKAAATWASKAYQVIRDSLQGSPENTFYYFFRSYKGTPLASGRATTGSFLVYLPLNISLNDKDIQSLSAHEMTHVFMADPYDPEGLGDWYVEGIADYLSVKLLYDSRLITDKRYLELRNGELAEYYTNRLRNVPNQNIPTIMWSGRNAWTTPYARGAVYFADLDGKIRKHKLNNVSVLSLVRKMNRLSAAGKRPTVKTWIGLIRKAVGEWAVKDFRSMMAGRLLVPVNNAFGPKFKRQRVKTQFFDMGFDRPKAIKAGEAIVGLDPKSAAAIAGLKEGDVIVSPVNLIPVYESYDKPVTITVKRRNDDVPVTFQPRNGWTTGYKWIFVHQN